MARKNGFTSGTKQTAIECQNGHCAFYGVALDTPWTNGYCHVTRNPL